MKSRRKKDLALLLIIILLSVTMGYALITTQLKINGSAAIAKNSWIVYWDNPVVSEGSITPTLPTLSAEQGSSNNTITTWSNTLNVPGDFYEFTIDAVNNGTIDAMISAIDPRVVDQNNNPVDLPSYIKYEVTYVDGKEIEENHLLAKKSGNTPTREKYKIRVEFLDTITNQQLNEIPEGGLSYTFSYHVSYVQADNNAIVRAKDYLKVMTSANGDTQPAFYNNNGIKKNQIEKIYTLKTLELPSGLQDEMIESWDVSANGNSSIMAYALDIDSNSKYEIYLAQEGGVKANPNSTKLFNYYSGATDIDVTNLITDDVESMVAVFQNCESLVNLTGEETWNTSRVTNMTGLFSVCLELTSLDLNNFDTSNVTSMWAMFQGCSKLTSLDLSSFNTSKVTNMERMFMSCSKLTSLDLSNFDMSKTTNTYTMFQGVGFRNIIMPNNYIKLDIFMFNQNSSYNQESFTIPKSVKIVEYSHIFYNFGNTNFKKFIVEEGSTTLKTIDDLLYTYDGTKLISIPNGKTFTDNTYVMPDSVTTLNTMCFNRTKKIDKVVISDNLVIDRYYDDTSSGDSDPVKGNRLNTGIYVFTSVKEYEAKSTNNNYSSYGGCIYNKAGTELIAVPVKYAGVLNIKDGTTTIGREAFWVQRVSQITNITEINIPASVTTIEANQLTTLNKLITSGVVVNIDSNNNSYMISNNKIVAK